MKDGKRSGPVGRHKQSNSHRLVPPCRRKSRCECIQHSQAQTGELHLLITFLAPCPCREPSRLRPQETPCRREVNPFAGKPPAFEFLLRCARKTKPRPAKVLRR